MDPSERYKIPKPIVEKNDEIRIRGATALRQGKYKVAKKAFEKSLELLFRTQSEIEKPLHKGDPFYNLGLAYLYLQDLENAIFHFLLAYIEDTLSSKFDYEDNADRAPAAQMIRDVFIFDLRVLREIKKIVRKIKKDDNLVKVFDPSDVLKDIGKYLRINLSRLINSAARKPKPVFGFQPRDLRVFIGTNYDVNIGIIPLVKDGIKLKNKLDKTSYFGIAATDRYIPKKKIHDGTLALLHTCYFAIIDVSHPGGQFNEIERLRDYGFPDKNILLLRQSSKNPNLKAHISGMITTLPYKIVYYYDPREIIKITRNFLL